MHKIFQKLIKHILIFSFVIYVSSQVSGQAPESVWSSPLHKCWDFPTSEMIRINGASDNVSQIYIPLNKGKIIALDTNGEKIWNLDLGGNFLSGLVHLNKNILTNTTYDQKSKVIQREIETSNGTIQSSLMNSSLSETFVIKYDVGRLIISTKGKLILLDQDQEHIWNKQLNTEITTQPIKIGKRVGFGTSNKTFILINIEDGEIITQINLRNIPKGKIFSDNKNLFIGDNLGNIYSLDLIKKRFNWSTKSGGEIVEIDLWRNAKNEDYLLVSSNDNYIYLIDKKNGNKIWKIRMAGRIIGKEYLDERTAIFLTFGTNTSLLIDLGLGKIINRIDLSEDIYFVSKPLKISNKVILPTHIGLFAYSTDC